MKQWLRITLFLLCCLVLGAAYWRYQGDRAAQPMAEALPAPTTVRVAKGTVQQTVSAPGTLVNTGEMALSLPVGGRLATLQVRPGQAVKAGESLAMLETRALAREEQRQHSLFLQAQLTYSQTLQLPDLAAIARTRLALDQAQHDWQDATADVQATTLLAPFAGVVTEIAPRVGENVPANSTIMVLTDPSALEVQAKVIEEDLPLVQIGQSVEVYFDAVPDLLLAGRVARINPLRLAGERPQYGVYISIDQPPPEVLAGMSSDVAIIIAHREGVLYLPRTLVRAGASDKGQVELWINGQRQRRQVQVGLRGDVYVEIVEGLQEGDEVVSQ